MGASIDEKRARCDQRALSIARTVREAAGAEEAVLFGSRARGDHRSDPDVDILLIGEEQPAEDVLRELEAIASRIQARALPAASGVELGWMTPAVFMRQRTKLNSLAREIAKDGIPVMPEDGAYRRVQYVFDQDEEDGHIDWRNVQKQVNVAMESARDLRLQVDADGFVKTSDRNFGYIAHRSLESTYKAVLGSHGIEYPLSGRDTHDLHKLIELMRDRFGSPAPGEEYLYLTAFGGSCVAVREQRPLEKTMLAQTIPAAVRDVIALKREPPHADY